MTDEEALALKPGQVVKTFLGGTPTETEVDSVYPSGYGGRQRVFVRCRRPGFVRPGKRYPSVARFARDVWPRPDLDRFTANAFADWLEERGERRAAAMLREAFPFVTAGGECTTPAQEAS